MLNMNMYKVVFRYFTFLDRTLADMMWYDDSTWLCFQRLVAVLVIFYPINYLIYHGWPNFISRIETVHLVKNQLDTPQVIFNSNYRTDFHFKATIEYFPRTEFLKHAFRKNDDLFTLHLWYICSVMKEENLKYM